MQRLKYLFPASYRARTLIWSHGVFAGTQKTVERHQYLYI